MWLTVVVFLLISLMVAAALGNCRLSRGFVVGSPLFLNPTLVVVHRLVQTNQKITREPDGQDTYDIQKIANLPVAGLNFDRLPQLRVSTQIVESIVDQLLDPDTDA